LIYRKILAGLQKELQNKYEISSTIRHRGEKGRRRETDVAGLLKNHLPEAYGVATGEVFSSVSEDVSPQCDIIIYDRLKTPVFGRNDPVQQIPIEGVYAIIEVKSCLDTHALRDAERKFRAVRKLYTATIKGDEQESNDDDKPTFFLFAYTRKASISTCMKFLNQNKEQDIILCALDSLFPVWIGLWESSRAILLGLKNPEVDRYSLLSFFYVFVLYACRAKLPPLDFKQILS
jgi:hypothetical protein